MRLTLPGRSFSFEVPDANLLGMFEPPGLPRRKPGEQIVSQALARPIGSPLLRELVHGRRKVVILVDDVTRPTPAASILPPLLDELAQGGISPEACSILIAGGTHRPMTPQELDQKLGQGAARSFHVACHCAHTADLISLDDPGGDIPIHINALATEADLLIGTGQILPHAIAGFAGGGKIVAPGICGRETIRAVHWSMHRVSADRLYWSRDHAVREAIDRVARRAGLRFLVNLILGKGGGIAAAVAGDPVAAHREGCQLARTYQEVVLPRPADVVIADALPFEADWWQAIKVLPAAARACRPGGTIIVLAECPEGFAPEYREPVTYGYPPADKIMHMVGEGVLDGIVGAHMLIGAAALEGSRRIVLVSQGLTDDEVMGMGFARSQSIQRALDDCLADKAKDATVTVLPAAAQVIPRVEEFPSAADSG